MKIYFKQLKTQNMLKRLLQLIVVLLIAAQGVMAQTVQIDSVTKPPGDIRVKVDMLSFTDVAAITFVIGFNSDLMDFTGIDSTQLAGSWVANASGDEITITYTSSNTGTGYNINGKAFDLLFDYHGGFSGVLSFDTTQCEVANSNLGVISPVTYLDGSVMQSTAVGTVSMTTITDTVGDVVNMPVYMEGTGFSDVSDFTFKISYDEMQVSFDGLIGYAISGMTANANNGVLEIEWTGGPINCTSSTHLFSIKFTYNGGNADLEFSPGSEVNNASLSPLATDYTDGQINPVIGTRSLTILNVSGTPDTIATPVSVPIVAADFTGDTVGAITLNIGFDKSKLAFTGITTNVLTGWTVNSNNSTGDVTLQWSGAGSLIADDTLVTLNFTYGVSGGLAVVQFESGTILKDKYAATLPTSLYDGSVASFTVSGQLTYCDHPSRPIGTKGADVTTVYLKNAADSTVAYTATTDSLGNYLFSNVAVGTYFLDAVTNIDAKWSYDASDAYLIYGTYSTMTGLYAKAANVSETVSGPDQTDAYIVYGSVNNPSGANTKVAAWTAPDWIFDNVSVNVVDSNVSQNFSGICSGDANAGFNPMP